MSLGQRPALVADQRLEFAVLAVDVSVPGYANYDFFSLRHELCTFPRMAERSTD